MRRYVIKSSLLAPSRREGRVFVHRRARFDPTQPASLEQFLEAAAAFRREHLGSKESARAVLASEGIYTLDGELTEEYRL